MSEVNGKANMIPVTDVTEEQVANESFLQVTEQIADLLAKGPAPVLFLRVGPDFGLDVVAMADDNQLVSMVMGLVTMLGANKIGEAGMAGLPPAMAQITAQVTGLNILNKIMSDQVDGMNKPAQTPAGDAGAVH